jgi:hypothetical protein
MIAAQLAATNEAVQNIIQANMKALASHQAQMTTILEAQLAAFSKTMGPGVAESIKADATKMAAMIQEGIKAATEGLKG